ncbi:glycosyltransferase [Sphaerochaeta pleomorpha str. Grapes]|uniref:Glycosyltransferase n=1 Tax=Sphaerochaeta pleomorpha (strain ATCC BAA-1885 / DSM 22778 / Grapes) TaxID=158190 RepID=G8QW91_SPHPG|nr:glycosyltransferase [Sphaerochaeta pleomorpha]AEV29389.1 glycosyltransferase [Sphaerochaeta pleomorpha str. Grapes]
MRVMHVLSQRVFSGAENVVCQIIASFSSYPDIEMVYVSPDGPISESLRLRNVRFYPMEKMSVSEVRRVIRLVHPDIIHAHDRRASVLAALSTTLPIISHMHVNDKRRKGLKFKSLVYLLSAPSYRHIFWVSKSAFEEFPFSRLLANKSSILINTMNKDEVRRRTLLDKQEYAIDVLFIGRITYQKNPQRLIHVLHELTLLNPTVKACIVGTGTMQNELENEIRANTLQDNVSYLGYVENPMKMLSQSKILLLTSRYEGTPMVALEAMILGIPIVSTPVDGMLDLVANGVTGFLSDDDHEMAVKMNEIITNPLLLASLSKATLEGADHLFDLQAYQDVLLSHYRKCYQLAHKKAKGMIYNVRS